MVDKILITTSGIGSRLGDLTDYTNKSLVRIGNKPAISLIIENYPSDCEFIITLGHFGEYVREFLTITYPDLNFKFVNVDKYKGVGASLGYSLLQAREHLQCPFIFNACDTLFLKKSTILEYLKSKDNFCVGSKREDSSQYATLLINNGSVKEIKRKGEINFDYAYVGVCGIRNYKDFWNTLENTYRQNPNDASLHEGHIINKMINSTSTFFFYDAKDWVDIGNTGELERARKKFSSFAEVLEKKNESIYFFDDVVVKFFADFNTCLDRVSRAKELDGFVPKVLSHGNNFYKYEKVKGDLLANCVNRSIFSNLLNWSRDKFWVKKDIDNFDKLCYNFYITKTENRIKQFLNGEKDKETNINGQNVSSVEDLMKQIDTDNLCSGYPVRFHGDFILDNILKTKDGFCLLDWRQDFAGNLETGDIYYDFAKLNHNLTINHKIVNKNLFNYNNEDCHILCNSRLLSCKKILKDFIVSNNFDYKKVEILTALIWINMAPLHEYPFNQFLFNFGKLNLYEALEND